MPKDWPRDDSLDADAGDNFEDDSSSDDETGFFVKIETLMGSTFHVFAYSSDTIELLKTRIAFQEGIAQKDQNLFISRRHLDNPNTALSDLGINEETVNSIPLRLITNISSGIPFKEFLTRDSSPPTQTYAASVPLPFLTNSRRDKGTSTNSNSDDVSEESLRLPRLNEDDIDGVLVLRDRKDRRVFVIIKRPSDPGTDSDTEISLPILSTRSRTKSRRNRINDRRQNENSCDTDNSRDETSEPPEAQTLNEKQKHLDRIRENARTLQKMNEIRRSLVSKRKGVTICKGKEFSETVPVQLPDINSTASFHSTLSARNRPVLGVEQTKKQIQRKSSPPNNNISKREKILRTGETSLNRLNAEILLEAKKTGGGCYGLLPYTDIQLLRYVQLKVKVLLIEQVTSDEFEAASANRFGRTKQRKSLIPTVVMKRREARNLDSENNISRRMSQLHTGRFDSIHDRNQSLLRERNNVIRSGSDTSLKSVLGSAKSERRQRNVIITPKTCNIRTLGSGGRRPMSGTLMVSLPGTASTIQKKKKKEGVVRCQECRKRIGVACRYQCRCGKVFCSIHRYAEAHKCTFDYKEEGRRQLEAANPLIVATKVDKI